MVQEDLEVLEDPEDQVVRAALVVLVDLEAPQGQVARVAPEDLGDLVVLRRQNLQQRHQGRQEDPVVLQQRSQVNQQLSLQQSLQGSQEAPAAQEVLVDQVALEALVDQVDLGALKHQDQVLPPKRQQPADLDVRQDRGVREVLVGPVDQADLVDQADQAAPEAQADREAQVDRQLQNQAFLPSQHLPQNSHPAPLGDLEDPEDLEALVDQADPVDRQLLNLANQLNQPSRQNVQGLLVDQEVLEVPEDLVGQEARVDQEDQVAQEGREALGGQVVQEALEVRQRQDQKAPPQSQHLLSQARKQRLHHLVQENLVDPVDLPLLHPESPGVLEVQVALGVQVVQEVPVAPSLEDLEDPVSLKYQQLLPPSLFPLSQSDQRAQVRGLQQQHHRLKFVTQS